MKRCCCRFTDTRLGTGRLTGTRRMASAITSPSAASLSRIVSVPVALLNRPSDCHGRPATVCPAAAGLSFWLTVTVRSRVGPSKTVNVALSAWLSPPNHIAGT